MSGPPSPPYAVPCH
ncbi:RNA binding (RRM/RBD/RNP motifs) family protein [Zea mays]|uniref:RNA binding (RRM/RBD/RNP motifs) family protein n=1 Tax=Zea mays TaxID=4577 RepID=A0A1D6J1F6_MAIZE|nr:RNA binding (RRM/RBD/RNP motifs) family protein [Zea mays]AQK41848.1 RNA binding (RRM/RBD/RNP motifs) family protein [Zea mays]AQK41877.1 RNA binding (RRM/RBD/RNP motifs) family protein [Zea mays]